MMDSVQKKRINLLSIGMRALAPRFASADLSIIDGGPSGLPALYILEEILSRLAFDLNLDQELLSWQRFELMIGTGPGG